MDTNELIKALVADTRRPSPSPSLVWWSAVAFAGALAAAIVLVTLGPRPDIAAALETPRVLLKFAFGLTLAASAFGLVRALSQPGGTWRGALPYLAAAPLLLAASVVLELVLMPPDTWATRMMGANNLACLTFILLIGLGPLAILLVALRHGAPTRQTFAGAIAGLLAGGIAAIFYAVHCQDDSPLFVATWYTIAIAGLALIGAAGANRFARW
jgi:hypothetical protein